MNSTFCYLFRICNYNLFLVVCNVYGIFLLRSSFIYGYTHTGNIENALVATLSFRRPYLVKDAARRLNHVGAVASVDEQVRHGDYDVEVL